MKAFLLEVYVDLDRGLWSLEMRIVVFVWTFRV